MHIPPALIRKLIVIALIALIIPTLLTLHIYPTPLTPLIPPTLHTPPTPPTPPIHLIVLTFHVIILAKRWAGIVAEVVLVRKSRLKVIMTVIVTVITDIIIDLPITVGAFMQLAPMVSIVLVVGVLTSPEVE